MAESRDLAKVADLLSLNALGVYEVNTVGGEISLLPRFLHRTLPGLEHLTWEREPTVNVVPLRNQVERFYADSAILWARTESGEAASKLRTFKPLPDVVVREGGSVRYVAFWALSDVLRPYEVEDANKRLAKYLNGGKYATAGVDFRFYLPGTILRVGRKRGHELPVELVRFEPAVHSREDVVGRLPDPPTDEQKREWYEAALERKIAAEQRAKLQRMNQLEAAADTGHL